MTSSMNEGRKYPLCRHSLNNRIQKEKERRRAPRAAVRVELTHMSAFRAVQPQKKAPCSQYFKSDYT